MARLEAGITAPTFTLKNQNDENITLEDYKGKFVALYFYPKASTPGCTTQACAIRDGLKELEELNTVILGVSPDEPKKLKKFEENQELNFTLISDIDKEVAQAYGVWVEKSMYGRKYWGMERTTFIISPEGEIVEVFPKVKPKEHFDKVTKFIKNYSA